MQDMLARADDLVALTSVAMPTDDEVRMRDTLRASLCRDVPALITDAEGVLQTAQNTPPAEAAALSEAADEHPLLAEFSLTFNVERDAYGQQLRDAVGRVNTLLERLPSITTPPTHAELADLCAGVRGAVRDCSAQRLRAVMDGAWMCTARRLTELRRDFAQRQMETHQELQTLYGVLEGLKATFRNHAEPAFAIARTSDEAKDKCDELINAAEEATEAKAAETYIKCRAERLRDGPALAKAATEIAEAEVTRKHAVRAYRALAAQSLQRLLRYFPEHRARMTEKLAPLPFDDAIKVHMHYKLDDFTIEGRIAENIQSASLGGDGDVDGMSTRVVLKRYTDHLQWMREVMAMQRIQHPFVGKVSGVFQHEHDYYICMPRYEGGTLTQWLELHRGNAEAVLRVLHQLASGLSAVHARGVVHCDIKPANILMSANSPAAHPCVIDFEFATSDSLRADDTMNLAFVRCARSVVIGGTLDYMAPELRRSSPQDQASLFTPALDAFALGVVLGRDILGSGVEEEALDDAGNVGGRFAYPAEGVSCCADTLRGYSEELVALIRRLTAAVPGDRGTVREAEEVLRGLWGRAQSEQHDEWNAKQRPVECVICGTEFEACKTAACESGHSYCRECVANLVRTRRDSSSEEEWMEPLRAGRGVRCCVADCEGCVPLRSLEEATLPEEGKAALRLMLQEMAARDAVAAYKRQVESETAVERALREMDETILNFCCPNKAACGRVVWIDFLECMSLTCPSCRTVFCAWCSATQSNANEGHAHVASCAENPVAGIFCYDGQVWKRHWAVRRRSAVVRYLAALPPDVADAVRRRLPIDIPPPSP